MTQNNILRYEDKILSPTCLYGDVLQYVHFTRMFSLFFNVFPLPETTVVTNVVEESMHKKSKQV